MNTEKIKIAVFLESEFIPSELDNYLNLFEKEGYEVNLVSNLWGQPELTFYSGKDIEGKENSTDAEGKLRDREERKVSIDFREIDLNEYSAVIMPANYVSVRFKYQDNSSSFLYARKAPVAEYFANLMYNKNIIKGFLCHGLWILTPHPELLEGRKVTCISNLYADIKNTGAVHVDKDVEVDDDIITGRDGHKDVMMIEEIIKQINLKTKS